MPDVYCMYECVCKSVYVMNKCILYLKTAGLSNIQIYSRVLVVTILGQLALCRHYE